MRSLDAILNESLDRYLQLRITSFFNLFRSTVLYQAEVTECCCASLLTHSYCTIDCKAYEYPHK